MKTQQQQKNVQLKPNKMRSTIKVAYTTLIPTCAMIAGMLAHVTCDVGSLIPMERIFVNNISRK